LGAAWFRIREVQDEFGNTGKIRKTMLPKIIDIAGLVVRQSPLCIAADKHFVVTRDILGFTAIAALRLNADKTTIR